MKSTSLLRVLSLFGFLLLLAPFYDQCNGRGMKLEKSEVVEISKNDDKEPIPVQTTETIEKENLHSDKEPFLTRAYEFVDNEETQNAYELAKFLGVYFDITFDDFNAEIKEDLKENKYDSISYLIRSIAFLSILIFTTMQLLSSFFKRYKVMCKLSNFNLISLLIGIICIVFFDSLFETFRQIKWGFYVFLVVQITLFYFSKSQLRSIPN